jgi:uncharacterized protein YceK
MARAAAAVALALALGACASVPSARSGGTSEAPAARPAPNVNLSGYNAAFKEGYADGCGSAREAQRRNAKRYGTDTDYTMGWNDGHAMCARR